MDSLDLTIYKYADYSLNITLLSSSGTVLDLTNSTVSGFVKFQYGDSVPMLNLHPTVVNAPSGIISLGASDLETSVLPTTIAPYDINVIYSGIITRVLAGNAYIYPSTTY